MIRPKKVSGVVCSAASQARGTSRPGALKFQVDPAEAQVQ